jgi:hypothetical protein
MDTTAPRWIADAAAARVAGASGLFLAGDPH